MSAQHTSAALMVVHVTSHLWAPCNWYLILNLLLSGGWICMQVLRPLEEQQEGLANVCAQHVGIIERLRVIVHALFHCRAFYISYACTKVSHWQEHVQKVSCSFEAKLDKDPRTLPKLFRPVVLPRDVIITLGLLPTNGLTSTSVCWPFYAYKDPGSMALADILINLQATFNFSKMDFSVPSSGSMSPWNQLGQ